MQCFLLNLILSKIIRRLQLSLEISAFVAQWPGNVEIFWNQQQQNLQEQDSQSYKSLLKFWGLGSLTRKIIMSIVENLSFLKSAWKKNQRE